MAALSITIAKIGAVLVGAAVLSLFGIAGGALGYECSVGQPLPIHIQ